MNYKIFFIIFILAFFVFPAASHAASIEFSGFAWSETIGWISFNCTDLEATEGKTCLDGNDPSFDPALNLIDYGVSVTDTAGTFSGFAWSENIGWIYFHPAPDFYTFRYPENPQNPATLNLITNQVSGWARACAGTVNEDCESSTRTDGWDGWIKTRGTSPNYGVVYNPNTREFEGWAWGEDKVGWMSFNSIDCDPDGDGITENTRFTNCPVDEITSDYAVAVSINQKPSAFDLTVSGNYSDADNFCLYPPHHTFSWTFSDLEDGSSQTSYEFEADNNSNFSSPEISVSGGSSTSKSILVATMPGANRLVYNETYYWRVKVFDSEGGDSGWTEAAAPFSTAPHVYPRSDFFFTPEQPSKGEEITFTQTATCRDMNNGPIACPLGSGNYRWDFDYETPFTQDAVGQSVKHTYADEENHTVALDVTDAEHQTCRHIRIVGPQVPFPKFREVAPTSFLENIKIFMASIFSAQLPTLPIEKVNFK